MTTKMGQDKKKVRRKVRKKERNRLVMKLVESMEKKQKTGMEILYGRKPYYATMVMIAQKRDI